MIWKALITDIWWLGDFYFEKLISGATNGSHLKITPPSDGMVDFLHRKTYLIVVLQAVVGVQYLEISIAVSQAVLRMVLYSDDYCSVRFCNKNCLKETKLLVGLFLYMYLKIHPVSPQIVSPCVTIVCLQYPVSPQIVKGYDGRNLTSKQETFNVYPSKVCTCEC